MFNNEKSFFKEKICVYTVDIEDDVFENADGVGGGGSSSGNSKSSLNSNSDLNFNSQL